jgi:cbb3-type cytochrome oxidase subunit 1
LPAFRAILDGACSTPVLVYFTSAVFWCSSARLLGHRVFAQVDMPDVLGTIPELTFGRIRGAF